MIDLPFLNRPFNTPNGSINEVVKLVRAAGITSLPYYNGPFDTPNAASAWLAQQLTSLGIDPNSMPFDTPNSAANFIIEQLNAASPSYQTGAVSSNFGATWTLGQQPLASVIARKASNGAVPDFWCKFSTSTGGPAGVQCWVSSSIDPTFSGPPFVYYVPAGFPFNANTDIVASVGLTNVVENPQASLAPALFAALWPKSTVVIRGTTPMGSGSFLQVVSNDDADNYGASLNVTDTLGGGSLVQSEHLDTFNQAFFPPSNSPWGGAVTFGDTTTLGSVNGAAVETVNNLVYTDEPTSLSLFCEGLNGAVDGTAIITEMWAFLPGVIPSGLIPGLSTT